MLKFFAISLLVVFHGGNAAYEDERDAEEYRSWKGLSELKNNESFKVAYDKATTEYPEFNYKARTTFDHYGKDEAHHHITLYSKKNPHGHAIDVDLEETWKNSTYDVERKTKIIVSPWHSRYTNSSELVTAYLRHYEEDVNVITINYKKFFGSEFAQFVEIYNHLVEVIAKLTRNLHQYGTSLEKVHIIGFGMSAHYVGGAAKLLYPLKVGRITGLDPSGIFDHFPGWIQLNYEDADFVDVISTNTRKYGTKFEHGSVHFYPNGGEVQPKSDDFTSHLKALGYFIESIASTRSFRSEDAKSWEDYERGHTYGNVSYMGEYVSERAHGKYFLYVNPLPPYSKDGKYELGLNDKMFYPRGKFFEITQKALRKEPEETYGQEVGPNDVADARTENMPSARRIYEYVKRASD